MPIRVVAVDDHHLMIKQFVEDFDSQPDIELVGTAEHINKLMPLVHNTRPNVVILDPGMPEGLTDPYFVRQLRQEYPEVQVIILTGYYLPPYIREVVAAGALGVVIKNDILSLSLPEGVRLVHQKHRFYSPSVLDALFSQEANRKPEELLTEQQRVVLRLVAQGFANSKIGELLKVSDNRVRNILSQIYHILNIKEDKDLNPRVAAVAKARKLGLLGDDPDSIMSTY